MLLNSSCFLDETIYGGISLGVIFDRVLLAISTRTAQKGAIDQRRCSEEPYRPEFAGAASTFVEQSSPTTNRGTI